MCLSDSRNTFFFSKKMGKSEVHTVDSKVQSLLSDINAKF